MHGVACCCEEVQGGLETPRAAESVPWIHGATAHLPSGRQQPLPARALAPLCLFLTPRATTNVCSNAARPEPEGSRALRAALACALLPHGQEVPDPRSRCVEVTISLPAGVRALPAASCRPTFPACVPCSSPPAEKTAPSVASQDEELRSLVRRVSRLAGRRRRHLPPAALKRMMGLCRAIPLAQHLIGLVLAPRRPLARRTRPGRRPRRSCTACKRSRRTRVSLLSSTSSCFQHAWCCCAQGSGSA